ncbi:MAG: hypothetical protein ACOCZJ_03930 [Thermoplasmatota archaeon]
MPLDSDRCHFCGNWAREYKKIGDKSICKECQNDLIELIKDKLEES